MLKWFGVIVITIVIVIVVVIVYCPEDCPDGCPSPATELIIADMGVSRWATLNNTFSGGGREVTDPVPKIFRPFWNGVLFQLGDFEFDKDDGTIGESEVQFKEIIIQGNDVPASMENWPPHPDGKKYWFNIVADVAWDPAQFVHLDPVDIAGGHPFYLYPNTMPGGCRPDPGCDCSCTTSSFKRRLHAFFDVEVGIITYWQGENAYRVRAEPRSGNTDHNEYHFDFLDPVTVTVYVAEGSGDGMTMELVPGAEFNEVETITVDFTEGLVHKDQLDPPYP